MKSIFSVALICLHLTSHASQTNLISEAFSPTPEDETREISQEILLESIHKTFSSGGGWNDDGGGNITDVQNNPWFLGDEPIKYCFIHGGPENFSLPKDKAWRLIRKTFDSVLADIDTFKYRKHGPYIWEKITWDDHGLYTMTKNLQEHRLWSHNDDFRFFNANDKIWLNTNFSFDGDCQSNKVYDFVVLLGAVDHPLIKKSRLENPKVFETYAGVAVKANYSLESLNAKGFIYLAADRGPFRYKGHVNEYYKRNDGKEEFWNNSDHFKNETFLNQRKPQFYPRLPSDIMRRNKVRYEGFLESPFRLVLLHEIGHLLGFKHGANLIMKDYIPEKLIQIGLVPNSLFDTSKKLLGRNLINFTSNAIAFDASKILQHFFCSDPRNSNGDCANTHVDEETRENFWIAFFKDIKDEINGSALGQIVFEFDRTPQGSTLSNKKNQGVLRIKKLEPNLASYRTLKSLPLESVPLRECSAKPSSLDYNYSTQVTLNFKPFGPNDPGSFVTKPLITLKNEALCGKIHLGRHPLKKRFLTYQISFRDGEAKISFDNFKFAEDRVLYVTTNPEWQTPVILTDWYETGASKLEFESFFKGTISF